ncbi:coiled-coil domain-containing protein 14-like [Sapajus apella]|uniref:Coiled-coil domain-containing protein 14-like n=1 Tax=Sapajus apella TaxID=9515 RepID=A0A6J3HFI1_SAPAP|nr:coiled-coil domain-containing protein 14-like [Sapajus apella]
MPRPRPVRRLLASLTVCRRATSREAGRDLLRTPKSRVLEQEKGGGVASETRKRGVGRDPFRKRKLGGRAKKVREPKAVNSFYREASLPSIWASLRLREMVRSGSRPGQVLSSGRHTGPAKLTNGKKGTHLRKISHFKADSGYSIHSDSESQAETVHGLDGCASLLRNILRNEDSGLESAYLENRSNSRPLDSRKYGSKKKRHEKHTVPFIVRKETCKPFFLLFKDNP